MTFLSILQAIWPATSPLMSPATPPALVQPMPQVVVPHEKYELANGLTVILHPDRTLPQACVNIWYRVGSKDERQGRSGFAHLFEHLMFMGTERVPEGRFDGIMETAGGWNNASTSSDRTNYYDSGPSELLPTLLWLEADRMEALGASITQEKLDAQRAVVRNERRQTSENRPYGKADLLLEQLLYPAGHPYHHPVIGSHADLEAATVDDVREFFAAYYVPSNASLVVAGDFDAETVKRTIDGLFGSLPRGDDAVHARAQPARLEEPVVHTLTDRVQFARTTLAWHSPPAFAPGDAELDLLAAILSEGIASRLQERLITKDQAASAVEASQRSGLLGSAFVIEATARPGTPLEALEIAIDEELSKLRHEGPTGEELERARAAHQSAFWSRMETIQARADALNRYEFHLGRPDAFELDLDRYRSATAEGLRAIAEEVLDPRRRVALRVLPAAQAPAGNPRDAQPAPASAKGFQPPLPEVFRLENGLEVQHWQRGVLPLVELTLLLPLGAASDPPGRSGLAALSGDMLDEGAGELDARAFADRLGRLGAKLRVSVEHEQTRVRLSALADSLPDSLALLGDAVLRPRFDPQEWERVHALHRLELERAADSPTRVARDVSLAACFVPEDPRSRNPDGTVADCDRITLGDVRAFHSAAWQPQHALLLCAGGLDAGRLRALLEASLGSWSPSELEAPVQAPARPSSRAGAGAARVLLVDRPEAVQSVISFVLPAPPWSREGRLERELATLVLGGSFTSRLNLNLREEHGFTYGANASLRLEADHGALWTSTSVRTDVTGAALSEVLKEFRHLREEGVRPDELEKARTTWRRQRIEAFSRLSGVIEEAAGRRRRGVPFDSLSEDLARLEEISSEALDAVAADLLPFEEGVLVVVGDAGAVLPQLDGLGLGPVERVDEAGSPASE